MNGGFAEPGVPDALVFGIPYLFRAYRCGASSIRGADLNIILKTLENHRTIFYFNNGSFML